ncbi:MAG: M67 family metallopeptidase [Actinobacteria bacterium]|nr:M67 family metallopeptidase [Actinomycetota bacterium]
MSGELLRISSDVHAAMVAHALAGVPHEACGLFAGAIGDQGEGPSVDRFYPMRNAAESRTIYQLDGQEQLDVEHTVDEEGAVLVGVMHSHTHTPAYPSPTDVADAACFDPLGTWVFVIVSLERPDPALCAFRILDGDITEVEIEVEDEVEDDSASG